MKIIWIGDQRSRQIKFWQEEDEKQQQPDTDKEDKPELEYQYILDDNADTSWFSSFAEDLAAEHFERNAVLLVNIGLNDCINSCIWSGISLTEAVTNFVKELNTIAAQNKSMGVYVCTVVPVNANIPRSEAQGGFLSMQAINEKVNAFNSYLRENCEATVIDCGQYLTDTSFATRDGLLLSADTCLHLSNYILNSFRSSYTSFPARLEKPDLTQASEDNKYWTGTAQGGYNVFAGIEGHDPKLIPYTGCALPNCTAWAWGRFYELIGEKPALSTGNAENWFGHGCSLSISIQAQAEKGTAADGYTRGETPKLGAVICWEGVGDKAGHVAIVEQINPDGSIITSESGWNDSRIWWTSERSNSNNNWGQGSGYVFQGFIYCPTITASGPTAAVNKSDVIVKAGALTQSEMEINALYIWNYLGSHEEPWTLNAVAGMLGNMQSESSINPGRHETSGSGFGLVQWTPKTNHTNWLSSSEFKDLAEDDMDGQLEHIIYEKNNGKQYYKNHYKYTFKEFAVSNDNAYELACAFAFDYERSGVVLWGFHTNSWDRKTHYCNKSTYDSKCETNCIACLPCYEAKFGAARTEQQKEVNREKLRKARGGNAEDWFQYLLPYAPGTYFKDKFVVINLKVDELNETSCVASFVTSHAESGSAHLYDADGNKVDSKTLTVTTASDNSSDEEEEIYAIVSFGFSGLLPNKYYSITIEINSDLKDEEPLAQTVEFVTPQSFPKPVTISLAAKELAEDGMNDDYVATWSTMTDNDWGYWVTSTHGFDVSLSKNGREVKTETVSASTSSITFKPAEQIEELKLDDSVQVCVNPWVTDLNGDRVYADEYSSASNSIRFLKQPIRTYLNM